ncbi:hypothetical protein EYF80_042074 [Liparis tanakae]|uniref:Secreted protein n=1 Tax=Liparis tanakae TaxID=230148 RepID=A0A4Z2G3X6_9TELE|nr:hypothetical protein EYF80_042074 [Liparis tanakae]
MSSRVRTLWESRVVWLIPLLTSLHEVTCVPLAGISSGGTSRCRDTSARGSVTRHGTTAGRSGRRYTISTWMADGTKRLSLSVWGRTAYSVAKREAGRHLRRESLKVSR